MSIMINSTNSDTEEDFSLTADGSSIEQEIFAGWKKNDPEKQQLLLELQKLKPFKHVAMGAVIGIVIGAIVAMLIDSHGQTPPVHFTMHSVALIVKGALSFVVAGIVSTILITSGKDGLHKLWKLAKLRATKSRRLEEKKLRFAQNPVFFYDSVISHLWGKANEIDDRVNLKTAEFKTEVETPRYAKAEDIREQQRNLRILESQGVASEHIRTRLESAIAIEQERLRTPSEQEIKTLAQITEAEDQRRLYRGLISSLKEKRDFHKRNTDLIDSANSFIEGAGVDEYQSINQTPASPILQSIQEDLAEINAELKKRVEQAREVDQQQLLSGSSPVTRLIESGSVDN